jgi:hypothetical protein
MNGDEKITCYVCGHKKLFKNMDDREVMINKETRICWDCQIKFMWLELNGYIKQTKQMSQIV